jgi:carbon storage regulator
MLVLSRKAGEQIRVGDNIIVTLLGIKGNKISIGITAPPDSKILREELMRRDGTDQQRNNGE